MVDVEFILNDYFLVSYLFTNGRNFIGNYKDQERIDVVNFLQYAWDDNESLYIAMSGRFGLAGMVPILENHKFSSFGIHIDEFIDKITKTKEYERIRDQTKNSIERCKGEWDKNFEKTSDFLSNYGIEVDGKYKIWMSHPAIRAGQNIGRNDIIWADRNDWPNYNTVYIWHEILHSYFDKFGVKKMIEEVIVQLLTDNEMRKMLNGTDYPPFEGHDDTVNMMEAIYPDWKEFLAQDKKDIKQFVEMISKKFGQDS